MKRHAEESKSKLKWARDPSWFPNQPPVMTDEELEALEARDTEEESREEEDEDE